MQNHTALDRRLQELPSEIWLKIVQIDELKGRWTAGIRLTPQMLGRLTRSVLITSSGASTRIEGAKLSDEDIEKFILGISIQNFSDRDAQEVKGYYELLQNIFHTWEHLTFSENVIRHFHGELLKYVDKDKHHKGKYKNLENKVEMFDEKGKAIGVVFQTTPPYLTAKEMSELVRWTENAFKSKKYHPLLVIANFVVEFLKIHPFQDGNGRLSRILTNFLLLKTEYLYIPYVSHEKIIEENKKGYYLALRKSQKSFKTDKESILPWLDYFLTVLLEQAQMAIELLSKERIENILSPQQLRVWQYIQANGTVAPGIIARNTEIPRPTVNQALKKLLKYKKIEQIGLGRGTRYRKL
jgi:Fic family protein